MSTECKLYASYYSNHEGRHKKTGTFPILVSLEFYREKDKDNIK
jgi:hypothetical protein